MAKKTAPRRAPDMSNYVSPRMPKGVRYLDGAEKVSLVARLRKAFSKVRLRQPA